MREAKKRKSVSLLISICILLLIFLLLSMPFMGLKYKDPPAETGLEGRTIPIKFNNQQKNEKEKELLTYKNLTPQILWQDELLELEKQL